ncbi:low-specificity L-threonine aldolase [Shewanella yunxiaonensis]|uniref:Low-specificity L-threonine aldolase n=1 Tax=Shewanella yunxiaonensis TaxID=2829809 RepID=A0ABX7YV53_9GAMM|nr:MULTISPECIES: low-specificity L-threonine aldolase [Shewanella]MDF0532809.1 low-specificity L-threonine aldolase [Shewanella sp. A32]QUN06692.1 low-specificity L-threonine aldolase [Shewanella yunxiaonensis]
MIDLRSDTVTQPTAAMRKAMAAAVVGDDVYGDDPTVNHLEQMAAEMFGFEEALFTTSGTQANLLALMSHCNRGDEYICGQQAHNYKYEAGGAAVLGSIQPQPIANLADGTLPLNDVTAAIKPDDFHFARTKLISLENTIGGKVLPQQYLAEAQQLAFSKGLKIHLDGARVANAAVAQNIGISEIMQFFDSATVCLSKGLCAPVGSLLLGDEHFIHRARRWRKMLGGGMRQAGILAAAGELALTQQVARLADDHANARILAEGLSELTELNVDLSLVQTNMVFAELDSQINPLMLASQLGECGVRISAGKSLRLVTHNDISTADIHTTIAAFKQCLAH